MIFVTVGAQMPFERLVRTVDEWAGRNSGADVFAQIGPTGFQPKHVRYARFLDPAAYRTQIESARVVVAHAGMGSILTALELGKPILVMPRRGSLQETRNDHQVATAEKFLAQGRIQVAIDEDELAVKLSRLGEIGATAPVAAHASPQLIAALRSFIESAHQPGARRSAGRQWLPSVPTMFARRRADSVVGVSVEGVGADLVGTAS